MWWTVAGISTILLFVALQWKFGRLCSPGTSQFCAGFSCVGSIFFFWVAMMLTRQPLFVPGIKDLDKARINAWLGMALYLGTFGVAMSYVMMDVCRNPGRRGIHQRRHSGNDYDGVPMGTGPPVLQEYASRLELPPSIADNMFSDDDRFS